MNAIKQIIEILSSVTPKWVIMVLLFGFDETDIRQMRIKEKDTLRINKYLHCCNKQIEFVWRAFIFNVICSKINIAILSNQQKFKIEEIIFIILIEILFGLWYLVSTFDQSLIGFDKNNENRMLEIKRPFIVSHVIFTLINIVECVIFIGYNMTTNIFIMVTFLFVFAYTMNKYQQLREHDIICEGVKNNINIGNGVDLEKDISIKKNDGTTEKIDLSKSNIYICDNDDIKIITSGTERRVVEKTTISLEKDTIQSINVKNKKIVYRNGKWELFHFRTQVKRQL